ncbi:DUF2795 domain-containing protein [Halorussus sp. MSC15.2]|uniref:DUF5789 family protein n=1 Tax=Halorussus sp. MSC15.2 TaxID=2283638 RepID=UPI0013D6C4F2|nr:DUF2795 domain-containing protein [Halorussus sp. MSC15.2]NEU55347.1 DUF2795 domain-containing protein [Halorussus sp. MSC15.2]
MSLKQATELIRQHDYPATTNQLADSYGDYELDHPNGTETLGEVLRRVEAETFSSSVEAEELLYSAVSSGAIGRKGYSDRDPTTLGTMGPGQVSF